VSTDGSAPKVLTAVSRPDVDTDEYRSTIELVDDGGTRRWSSGDHDTAPVASPDGRWLAFLRAVPDEGGRDRAQLAVVPTDGGEARVVSALPLGADGPVWSPDSRRIAVVARFPEPGRYGTEDTHGRRPAADAEAPRLTRRLDHHTDGTGYLRDRFAQLVIVDVEADAAGTGSPISTPLTSLTCSVSAPVWTPDGSAVLVTAPRDLGATETHDSDLYRVDLTSGSAELAVLTAGSVDSAAFGPDGTLFFVGATHEDGVVGEPDGLWAATVRPDGSFAPPVRLTDRATVHVAGPAIARDGDVLVAVLDRGTVQLRSVAWSGETPSGPATLETLGTVLGGHVVVSGFDARDGLVAAAVATPDSPGEIVLVDTADQDRADADGMTVATDLGAEVRHGGVRRIEELHGTSADGTPVHGWVVLPDGDGPHPVLRVVHGGPFGQDTWAFFDEAQVYASAGYAVVIGNPRGSAGYGLDHGRAVIGAMGTVDVDDVLALLDAALERDDLDASRVGIMGGSYGGFMTSWLAAHHGERFVAAWSERAVNAWDSFAGSSDIGWFFADAYVGSDPEEQRRRSPLTYADRVSIPFMVAHSEQDWRCPIEQGQRQYVALRRAGVDASFLVFPGEGHELSRSGRPRHRVQRFEHVLAWWGEHLPVG
jgi:dipeptidyl aminopeptidase/acylaminoacyl peptidase